MENKPIGSPYHKGPRQKGDAAGPSVSTPIGARHRPPVDEPSNLTADAGAPNVRTHFDPPNFIELGYGTGPRCIECRQNVSMCLCNVPEPDVMPVEDMKRVMPELFADSGWGLAERSAYGMGAVSWRLPQAQEIAR